MKWKHERIYPEEYVRCTNADIHSLRWKTKTISGKVRRKGLVDS